MLRAAQYPGHMIPRGIRCNGTAAGLATAFMGCSDSLSQLNDACSVVEFELELVVTVESKHEVDDLGMCDEEACSTDAHLVIDDVYAIPATSAHEMETGVWSFSLSTQQHERARFVAIVEEEEIDLGWHDLEWSARYPEGAECPSIPTIAPITIQLDS